MQAFVLAATWWSPEPNLVDLVPFHRRERRLALARQQQDSEVSRFDAAELVSPCPQLFDGLVGMLAAESCTLAPRLAAVRVADAQHRRPRQFADLRLTAPVEESFRAGVQQVAHVGARLEVTLGVAVAHRFQHALDF
jgi:hypothetical protein